MGSVREGFELIFVAVFAGLAAHIIVGFRCRRFGSTRWLGLRRTAGSKPTDGHRHEGRDQDYFDEFKHWAFPQILFDLD